MELQLFICWSAATVLCMEVIMTQKSPLKSSSLRAGTFYPRSEHQFEREVKGDVVKLTHGHDFLLHPTAFVGTLDLL